MEPGVQRQPNQQPLSMPAGHPLDNHRDRQLCTPRRQEADIPGSVALPRTATQLRPPDLLRGAVKTSGASLHPFQQPDLEIPEQSLSARGSLLLQHPFQRLPQLPQAHIAEPLRLLEHGPFF